MIKKGGMYPPFYIFEQITCILVLPKTQLQIEVWTKKKHVFICPFDDNDDYGFISGFALFFGNFCFSPINAYFCHSSLLPKRSQCWTFSPNCLHYYSSCVLCFDVTPQLSSFSNRWKSSQPMNGLQSIGQNNHKNDTEESNSYPFRRPYYQNDAMQHHKHHISCMCSHHKQST